MHLQDVNSLYCKYITYIVADTYMNPQEPIINAKKKKLYACKHVNFKPYFKRPTKTYSIMNLSGKS